MSYEPQCDIHDVTRAAADLVALGCTVGATHFYDGVIQSQFSSFISNYANEVIKNVNDGTISAWDGVQEIRAEHSELTAKVLFYVVNGIVVAAGIMQIKTGMGIIAATRGLGAPAGALMGAHGINNMYEGGMNIYNGMGAPGAIGPIKEAYRAALGDEYKGDMTYNAMDLALSGYGAIRPVRKKDSFWLFNELGVDYEKAYVQMGRIAMFFEMVVDAITINSMHNLKNEQDSLSHTTPRSLGR